MKPGDIVFHEDPIFGKHRFWEIESVELGAEDKGSLVKLRPLNFPHGDGHPRTTLVPEVFIRGKVYARDPR